MIVAEVAQAHDGSLGFAHAFIDAIARAGADAVKFQTHIAAAESSSLEPWRVRFSMQDESRYDYWRRMQFTEEQWLGLHRHSQEAGLQFLSSPFSVEAAEMLKRVGVAAWKIASGENGHSRLLDCIADTGLPVILSTGMSSLSEIDTAVARIQQRGLPLTVLQCTSEYPCGAERIGLNLIPLFRERYGCRVGLSDHSGAIYAGIAAAVLGIDMLEVHVTLSREMFGPDVCASVTTAELRQLVDGVRFVERAMRSPVDKDRVAGELTGVRAMFTKSVVAEVDIPAGVPLTQSMLGFRKPGTAIPAERLPQLLGLSLKRAVRRGEFLNERDFAEMPATIAVG
jgi:N-acetylneuraminate synthase